MTEKQSSGEQGQQQDFQNQQQGQQPNTETPAGQTGGNGGEAELEIGSVEGIVNAILSPDFLENPEDPQAGDYVHKDKINDIITNRLNSEREARRAEAERQALEKNQEFKQLYETEKVQRESLEAKAAQADKYGEVFEQTLKGLKQGVPEHVTSLLEERDPLDQFRWLQQHRASVVQTQSGDEVQVQGAGDEQARQPAGSGVAEIPATAQADPNQRSSAGRSYMDDKYKDNLPNGET